MTQRGLIGGDGVRAGQGGFAALDAEQQVWGDPSTLEPTEGVLDPFFRGTRWTHDDVRTLSSFASFLVALLILWEVARG